jgi:arylsulfatase A-like enzyme
MAYEIGWVLDGGNGLMLSLLLVGMMSAGEPAKPNVIIFYADDLGYGDIGVNGARGWKTPTIDQLAHDGRQFKSFYVAQPVCSASRTALLTGCYPHRLGIHGALNPKDKVGIAAGEVTLGELCRSQGYATAVFGKWHLGWQKPFLPLQNGFDEYVGLPYSNDMWPYTHGFENFPPGDARRVRDFPPLPLFDGNEVVNPNVQPEDQKGLTKLYADKAISFIERNQARPFFLYVPFAMPHVPLYATQEFVGSSQQGLYGDVVQEIDANVGRVVGKVDELGLGTKTLIIFTSDNGPWTSFGEHAGTSGGLREAKGTCWEGGVRVPCVMRWKGTIPAGTSCEEPIMTIDLFPTIAKLINAPLPDHSIDGKDVWPLLAGQPGATSPQEAYFFYYNRGEMQAMRSGKWKLIFPHKYRTLSGRPGGKNGLPAKFDFVNVGLELYDLEADRGETQDVAQDHPDVVERLSKLADAARARMGDTLTRVVGSDTRPSGKVP